VLKFTKTKPFSDSELFSQLSLKQYWNKNVIRSILVHKRVLIILRWISCG